MLPFEINRCKLLRLPAHFLGGLHASWAFLCLDTGVATVESILGLNDAPTCNSKNHRFVCFQVYVLRWVVHQPTNQRTHERSTHWPTDRLTMFVDYDCQKWRMLAQPMFVWGNTPSQARLILDRWRWTVCQDCPRKTNLDRWNWGVDMWLLGMVSSAVKPQGMSLKEL